MNRRLVVAVRPWLVVALVGLTACRSRDVAVGPVTHEEKPIKAPVGEPEEDNGVNAPKDVAGPPVNALRTSTGLATRVLRMGAGHEHPGPTSKVRVHYTGWTTDGQLFDSSVKRGKPATFPLNGVIKGWTEGVQLMVVGEKRRFWIPEELAYAGKPRKPPGMLVFDIELLEISAP